MDSQYFHVHYWLSLRTSFAMTFSLLIDDCYIFEDSLSDVKNFLSLTDVFLARTPFYSPGQFTNGVGDENSQPVPNDNGQTKGIGLDSFAQKLNLEFSSFYPDPNNVDTTKDGTNFAIAAATSGDANLALSLSNKQNSPSLTEKLNDLTSSVNSLEFATTFSSLIDNYYILGDSLSDDGNSFSLTSSLPTIPLYFPGQFTNGLVDEYGQPIPNASGQTEGIWLDYFAQKLNLEFSSFYSDPGNVDTTKDGMNFAIGGATSGNYNIGLPFPAGLTRQLNDLTTTVDSLEDDLAFVWIGANDYFNAISTFPETDVEDDVEDIVTQVVEEVVEENILRTLTILLEKGAEILVVPNLPDLKETPLGNHNPILTQLTETHNQFLDDALEDLREDYPATKIISVDIYTFFTEILDTFSNTEQGVTATDIYNGVFDPNLYHIAGYQEASDNAHDAVWWDSAHPTTAVHSKIADYILETIESELVISGTNDKDELIGGNGKEHILGLNGKDTITGGTGDDIIEGGKGRDRLFGEEGDDTLVGGEDRDLIDGGDGSDTVLYDGFKDNFTFKGTLEKFKVKGPGVGTDTLIDIEFLQFQDGVFATRDLLI